MSLVKNEKVETNKNELEVFIDAETFRDACRKVYLRKVKQFNVPGFRKGKAPKKVVEKVYGSDVFFDSAIDMTYPKAVDEAIKKEGLDVVGLEKLEPIELSEEKGCRLRVVCVLKPEVKIENYKGLEIKAVERKVDDEAVQNQIKILKERSGKLIIVEDRAAALGDVVFIDFEGFVDGKAFSGGAAKNYNLKLGSGQFINGFEDQVVGHKIGEEFEVDVVFPEDYHKSDLSGKPAKFKCKLNEIKVLQLPEEDDEFAKDVSKFSTLKELKDDIRLRLTEQFKKQFDESVNSEISNFLVNNVDVQIPEIMLLNKTDELANNFENNLASQGFDLNRYLTVTNMSGYDLKDTIKAQAEIQLKNDLALEKIAELEKIKLVSDDYEKEREDIAKIYGVDVEKIKNMFTDEFLEPKLKMRKAFDFLRSNAKISGAVSENKSSKAESSLKKPANKAATSKTAKTSQTKKAKSVKIESEKSKSKSKFSKSKSKN